MGDGDKVGDRLKGLANQGDDKLRDFTTAMRKWGEAFKQDFPKDIGRVIYAGGDDFLGVIYSENIKPPIPELTALEWLMEFPTLWEQHGTGLTVSMGFVWAAPRVPQRDVLQHCREAQAKAKSLGRDRCTIRILFNSGQYIDWTCPWEHLDILTKYQDREGIGYQEDNFHAYQNRQGKISNKPPNWNHIYQDLAHLKARHAIEVSRSFDQQPFVDKEIALNLLNLYFPGYGDVLENNTRQIVGKVPKVYQAVPSWINGLIHVGWYLCRKPVSQELESKLINKS